VFLAYLRGETRVCSVLRVPTVEDEDRRRRSRARERLLKERTSHTNRLKSMLHAQGIRDAMPLKPGFVASLETVRTGDGRPLPCWLKQEIVCAHERLCLANKQIKDLEAQSKAELRRAAPGSAEAKIMQLIDLKGLGWISAQQLVHEVFYRSFDNRRQVGSYFGLTGTPYDSGASRGSARPATGAPASWRSSSPGCGSRTSPIATCPAGSASGWATSRGASSASPLWRSPAN
jgi:transposase